MGTQRGDRVDKYLYYLTEARSRLAVVLYRMNPRRFEWADIAFGIGFSAFFAGVAVVVLTDSVWISTISIVGMFFAFCVMTLTVGYVYVFKDEELGKDDGAGSRGVEGNDPFGGDAFEERRNL